MVTPTFQYQEDGAAMLVSRERFGLHDEMGVGKTAQAIRAINMSGASRGIIICPATLRQNWINEFRKFSHVSYRIAKGQNIHDFNAWRHRRFHFIVTSYELATRWAPKIVSDGEPIDFVAMDEAQYLKNGESQRSKAILGADLSGGYGSLLSWTGAAWDITGTRMSNDPLDIYSFLRMVRATPLDRQAFIRRYLDARPTTYGIRTAVKTEAIEELRGLLYSNSIRRTKQQVGIFLPPVFLTDMVIDGDTSEIKEMLRQHPNLEKAIQVALSQEDKPWFSFLENQHVATLRRLIATAKAVPYGHMLVDELAGNMEKRVVFGHHVEPLNTIKNMCNRHGIKAVIVNGPVSENDRNEAIRAFQEDEDCRVILGNIRAAGTGLTLTAACELDMFEADWAPAPNAQAIMRVHRIGQTRQVRARFIKLANSFDEVVTKIVADKTAAIASVDGHEMTAISSH